MNTCSRRWVNPTEDDLYVLCSSDTENSNTKVDCSRCTPNAQSQVNVESEVSPLLTFMHNSPQELTKPQCTAYNIANHKQDPRAYVFRPWIQHVAIETTCSKGGSNSYLEKKSSNTILHSQLPADPCRPPRFIWFAKHLFPMHTACEAFVRDHMQLLQHYVIAKRLVRIRF